MYPTQPRRVAEQSGREDCGEITGIPIERVGNEANVIQERAFVADRHHVHSTALLSGR